MTLLQHLAAATRQQPGQARDAEQADGNANGHGDMQPGLILVIEEPEVYQHPTKQRHIARVLEDLASGRLPGAATATQVVYCTHSPLFMSMDRFEEVRVMRRERPEGSEQRECVLRFATLDQVAEVLGNAWQRQPGTFSGDGLKPKLHIMDSGIAEGFFASVAVVVEGVSDRAAILAAASLKDIDLEAREIAVVVATGKGNIDKPVAIFRELGIPTYAVWDSDGRRNEPEMNRVLQRLCGAADADIEDSCDHVRASYACFQENLETTIRTEIGEERYVRLLDALKAGYGVASRDDAQKTPAIMMQLLEQAADEGARSDTLERIIDAILVLVPARAAPVQAQRVPGAPQLGAAAVPA